VVAAAECAIAIQKLFAERNAGLFWLFQRPNTGSDDQPSISTMSNVTIRESGSKSGVGSCGLTISASGRVADCSQRSLALYGSPSKYICVTRRFKRPVTSKWMCAGRMMFASTG
jgi:hypothetical protein